LQKQTLLAGTRLIIAARYHFANPHCG